MCSESRASPLQQMHVFRHGELQCGVIGKVESCNAGDGDAMQVVASPKVCIINLEFNMHC